MGMWGKRGMMGRRGRVWTDLLGGIGEWKGREGR